MSWIEPHAEATSPGLGLRCDRSTRHQQRGALGDTEGWRLCCWSRTAGVGSRHDGERGQGGDENSRGRVMLGRKAMARALWCALAVVLVVPPSESFARLRTGATIFRAFRTDGTPTIPVRRRSGYCWTGSLAVNRYDAWRCAAGNEIGDPCFSSDLATGYVVCPNGYVSRGVEIRLTRRLPYRYADSGTPSRRAHPWAIVTLSGRRYVMLTGATKVVDGQRLNYGCLTRGCGSALWGGPRRNTEPWTILWAPFDATSLRELAKIRRVWT
jgi:hypothetical protein